MTSGQFSSTYLTMNIDKVLAERGDTNPYLSIMDQNFDSRALMTVTEADNFVVFQDVLQVDEAHFLLTAWSRASHYNFQGYDIDAVNPGDNNSFIALLDTTGAVKWLKPVSFFTQDLFKGQDDEIYLHVRSDTINESLLKLTDIFSSTRDILQLSQSWNISPTLLRPSEFVTVSTTDQDLSIEQVTLYDVTGKLIVQQPRTSLSEALKVNTTGLSAGFYIVQVEFDNGMSDSKQIIIQ